LTQVITPYNAIQDYIPGDLARVGTNIYECIKAGTGQSPALPGSPFWISKGLHQTASRQDMVPILNQVANFTLDIPATTFHVRVYGLNTLTQAYSRLVKDEMSTGPIGDPSPAVQVDLSSWPGFFRVF
jgi:hypothetical protein